ncbi:hypothetical protein CCMA1212_000245 [Trichoderma ghanense]|uniref:SSCRP protein n=1 Tax=Trichoderma ghanense TaxID=65468 RepID=A0ABY2HH87_9HYPO
MKLAIVPIALTLANVAVAQWTCDPGFQCGSTIVHRDDSSFWIKNLKNAEIAVGRSDKDPLWDLFRCNGDRTISFVKHCPGRCLYGGAGQDRCEG